MKKPDDKTKEEKTDISIDPKRAKRFSGDDFPDKKKPKKTPN
jgi:hypothetical protein